jgi:hypothetical protein
VNRKTLVTILVLIVAAIAFLASGYRIPKSVTEGVMSVAPSQATQSADRIPRNSRGDICQLGEACRPNEVQRAPLGGER